MFIGETNDLMLELAEKDKEIAMLHFINKIRDNARDPSDLYSELLKKSVNTIESELGFIILNKGKSIEIKAKEGEMDKKVLGKLTKDAIKNNQPTIFNRILNEELLRANISSILSIPLVFDNEPVGAFILLNKKFSRSFNRYDMKLTSTIARQIYFVSKKLDLVNSLDKSAKTLEFEKISKAKVKKTLLKKMADLFESELGFVADVKASKAKISTSTQKLVKDVSTSIESVASESAKTAKMVNHLNQPADVKSIVCIPVKKDSKVKTIVGLVNSKHKKFSTQDKELFKAFVKKCSLLN